MRVLVATDAWHPQVNGVVRTLSELQSASPRFGAEISFLTHQGLPSFPLPTYPDIRCAIAAPSAIARRIEGSAARRDPYRNGRHDRARGAPLLHPARHPVHVKFSYAACGLCRGARANPGKLGMALAAPLSRPRRARHGIDADARFPNCRNAASEIRCCGRGEWTVKFSRMVPLQGSTCRARFFSRSAASRSRKISKPFCRSTCRAARSW